MAGESHRDSSRERGMSARAIARMDAAIARRVDKAIQKKTEKFEAKIAAQFKAEAAKAAASFATAANIIARRLDAAANAALKELETRGGDPAEIAKLRARIEGLEGATSAVLRVAPFLGALPAAARIAIGSGAAALGAAGEDRAGERKRSAEAASREDDRGLATDRAIEAARDATDRLVAARKRARGRPQ